MANVFKDFTDEITGLSQIEKIRQRFGSNESADASFIKIFKIIINIYKSSTESPRAGDHLITIKDIEVDVYLVKVNHYCVIYSIKISPPEMGLLCFLDLKTENIEDSEELIERARFLHS